MLKSIKGVNNDNSSHESIRARLSKEIETQKYTQEVIESFKMADEGQRLYDAASLEAQNDDGACGENVPTCSVGGEEFLRQWQYRMDAADMMQQAADDMANDVEARAIAAGVDVPDMLYLVDQHFYGPALAA